MWRLVFLATDRVAVSLPVLGPHLRRHLTAAYLGVDRSPTGAATLPRSVQPG
jgi:hypothetical protein